MEIEHSLIELNQIEKWCAENGFDVYRHGGHVGIICEYGDRKLLFLKGDDESPRPAFFSWSPCPRHQGEPDKLILLPYPGDSLAVFLKKLNASRVMATNGIDHLNRPYDKEIIWRQAQADFLAGK